MEHGILNSSKFMRTGLAALSILLGANVASAGSTSLVTLSYTDTPVSASGIISKNGRFVLFTTADSNVVPNDTNGQKDIFVRDLETGEVERVSIASDGSEANRYSDHGNISATGRYVLFRSLASNLVSGDTNGTFDLFIHDRETRTTELVSLASDGSQANGISSYLSDVTPDGRFVAFGSYASNLVPNDTNGHEDVFVRDREKGETRRVSVSSSGSQARYQSNGPSISPNGRFVAFSSVSNDLVPGDTNEERYDGDVFVHDLETGITERVSISSTGAQASDSCGSPNMSSDGRYVVFSCYARNLVSPLLPPSSVYVYLRDRENSRTELVSIGNDGAIPNSASNNAIISEDGRYVAFTSAASNLVAGDNNGMRDVFVRDRENDTTRLVSVATDGTPSNGDAYASSMTSDGQAIAFYSYASTLGPGSGYRTFVHNLQPLCSY